MGASEEKALVRPVRTATRSRDKHPRQQDRRSSIWYSDEVVSLRRLVILLVSRHSFSLQTFWLPFSRWPIPVGQRRQAVKAAIPKLELWRGPAVRAIIDALADRRRAKMSGFPVLSMAVPTEVDTYGFLHCSKLWTRPDRQPEAVLPTTHSFVNTDFCDQMYATDRWSCEAESHQAEGMMFFSWRLVCTSRELSLAAIGSCNDSPEILADTTTARKNFWEIAPA